MYSVVFRALLGQVDEGATVLPEDQAREAGGTVLTFGSAQLPGGTRIGEWRGQQGNGCSLVTQGRAVFFPLYVEYLISLHLMANRCPVAQSVSHQLSAN